MLEKKESYYTVIIVGGGLAGLTSAIHLAKFQVKVLLIEKNQYPAHKVCGEYVSNEVLPYLKFLGIDPFLLGAKAINRFELSTTQNEMIETDLPLGGFGISRYTLDEALANKAKNDQVEFLHDTVTNINFKNDEFIVETKGSSTFKSRLVIGAYGKRSIIDSKLKRSFFNNKSPYLAVKTHMRGDFPDDLVALHNFKGGYCGVSKVEDGSINVCYITNYDSFKHYKNIEEFQQKVVLKNDHLNRIFTNSVPVFEKPLSISQISFSTKKPVERHVIMCGDTAGMIHPLCGNGMSMAIRSSQMASQFILAYFNDEYTTRTAFEKAYAVAWNREFKLRLKVGHVIASLFRRNRLAETLLGILKYFPTLLPRIIKLTHGELLTAKGVL